MTAIGGMVLLAFGALVTVCNLWVVVSCFRTRKHISMIPLLGGALACVGCGLIPAFGWKLGLIALGVDPACGLMFVGLLATTLRSRWKRERRTSEGSK